MKYIFIDSNQYRHLFSREEGFSDDVYNFLVRLINSGYAELLLPIQTKDEVEKGRLRKWPEDEIETIEKNHIADLYNLQKKIQDGFKNHLLSESLLKEINEEIKRKVTEYEKEIKKIYNFFIEEDNEPNKKFKSLFKKAVELLETPDIINKARTRKEKGNPPYGRSSRLGDALIWESLLSYLKKKKEKELEEINLIFISSDKEAWGKDHFDRFLEGEYKEQIGGDIFSTNKLSDIPSFTVEEVEKITEKIRKEIEALKEKIRKTEIEESKRNAIIDFLASPSFIEAGERARKLIQFKEYLTINDYKMIIRGSLSNPQIYQSFFTPPYLLELVKGEDDYVVKEVEPIDSELWRQFSERYNIYLKRQLDGKRTLKNEIRVEDIPF